MDTSQPLEEGVIVVHSLWGRGRIVEKQGAYLIIYFPSLDGDAGGAERKLRDDATQLAISGDQETWPAGVGRLRRGTRTRTRPVVGTLDQAISWFRIEYPRAFKDPAFIQKEIVYKREGHALWTHKFGKGRAKKLLDGGSFESIADGLNAVAHATNIPSKYELMALNDGLKDHQAAAQFLAAILRFNQRPEAAGFEAMLESLDRLPGRTNGSRVLTWPNLTIFPFLAEPSRFMVLKPVAARKIADRLHWDLPYASRPTWHCFESWSRLGESLLDRLSTLGARDYIDVQSFLWETRNLD